MTAKAEGGRLVLLNLIGLACGLKAAVCKQASYGIVVVYLRIYVCSVKVVETMEVP